MKIALVMLAAGNSRRFGSNKLLYEIEGKPMYLLTLEKLKKASEKIPESEIIVVTQYEEIVKKAGEMKIPVFINPRPEDGISLSMQIGLMSVRVRRNAYRNPADYAFDIFADTGRSAFAEAGNQCSGC